MRYRMETTKHATAPHKNILSKTYSDSNELAPHPIVIAPNICQMFSCVKLETLKE
jgi:hypothetical protein